MVDDNSTDNTYYIIENLIADKENYFLYKADLKKYPGKKGALEFGISRARFNFILITDADCIVPPKWLKLYSKKFSEEYDFVFAKSPFFQNNTLVNKISCFENLRSSILTFSFFKMGLPYNAFGRNMGFSKKLFETITGYENTLETLSGDDDLLLREAVKNNFKIGVIEDPDAFVYSYTKNNFNDYLKQKSRHLKTSHHYLPSIKYLLGSWHLINLIMLLSILLVFITPYFLIPALIKIMVDLVIVKLNQGKYGYKYKNYQIVYLQILYEYFIIINFLNSFIKKDSWG